MNYAFWWAVAGLLAIFATAIFRLGDRGIATLQGGLTPAEWLALLILSAAFVYGEGIRALARRWVPFVIARAARLNAESPVRDRILAPVHAMALVGAPPRTLLRAWAGVLAIGAAVLIVRALPEPWRGIIDFAVAAALICGLIAIAREAWRHADDARRHA